MNPVVDAKARIRRHYETNTGERDSAATITVMSALVDLIEQQRRALVTVRDLANEDLDGPRIPSTGGRPTFIYGGTAQKIRQVLYEALK